MITLPTVALIASRTRGVDSASSQVVARSALKDQLGSVSLMVVVAVVHSKVVIREREIRFSVLLMVEEGGARMKVVQRVLSVDPSAVLLTVVEGGVRLRAVRNLLSRPLFFVLSMEVEESAVRTNATR